MFKLDALPEPDKMESLRLYFRELQFERKVWSSGPEFFLTTWARGRQRSTQRGYLLFRLAFLVACLVLIAFDIEETMNGQPFSFLDILAWFIAIYLLEISVWAIVFKNDRHGAWLGQWSKFARGCTLVGFEVAISVSMLFLFIIGVYLPIQNIDPLVVLQDLTFTRVLLFALAMVVEAFLCRLPFKLGHVLYSFLLFTVLFFVSWVNFKITGQWIHLYILQDHPDWLEHYIMLFCAIPLSFLLGYLFVGIRVTLMTCYEFKQSQLLMGEVSFDRQYDEMSYSDDEATETIELKFHKVKRPEDDEFAEDE